MWQLLVFRGLFPEGFCSEKFFHDVTLGELNIRKGELTTQEMLLSIWNVFDPDFDIDVMPQTNVSGNTRKEIRIIWEVRRYYFQRREVFQTKDQRMIEEASDSLGPRPAPLSCPWMASLTEIQNKWWNWSPSVTRSLPADIVSVCNHVLFIFSFTRRRDLSLEVSCRSRLTVWRIVEGRRIWISCISSDGVSVVMDRWIAKSLCPLQREIVVICNVIWRSWWCSWTFFWVSILRRTPEESLSSMSSHGSPADPSLECPLTDGSPPDVLSSFDPCRDFEDVQDKVQMSVRKKDFKRHDFNPDWS